ncbi:MAG TPA: serine--tRNA ligase [Polyangiaceae bacterium]|jgi:seryl-tRNA synthetase|nr:serine--tRNA ligase [Polyangiaceae bacterium]
MLDARYVADHLDEVRKALGRRSAEAARGLDGITELGSKRRELTILVEQKQAERNAANQDMAKLVKTDRAAFEQRREELKVISGSISELETELAAIEAKIEAVLLAVPNVPHASVPLGDSEKDNPVVRTWGEKPTFRFDPKSHWDIGEKLKILDFERASKLSGARFSVLFGLGARLSRALADFMVDLHTRVHGYTEVAPPLLVRASALVGTGQLPKFEADLFKTGRGDPDDPAALYLIPTAEVPLTNLHADEILEGPLPIAYTAYTPCFRSEAGSHGRDVRGLIRQHQFDKVEVVRIVEPEKAESDLELLTSHAEAVLQRLGLHYRVVELCAGDLGFGSQKTYDLEVWLPGQGEYREISSCSWFGDYQARRAKIRYRPQPKAKPRFAHTLNGSGLAVGRTLVAVLEQYQQSDGSVIVPEALRDLVKTDRIRPP